MVTLPPLLTKKISDDGVQLLLREAVKDDDGSAVALAQDLGGLPLALKVAGALIKESPGLSYADYRERMGQIVTGELPEGASYTDSLLKAVNLSWGALEPDARRVVELCAWWAPDGLVPRLIFDAPGGDWWNKYKDDVPDNIAELARDSARVETAFQEAARLNLLTLLAEGYAMHRMTATALRAEKAANKGPAAAAQLKSVYPYDADDHMNWDDCARLTPHARAIWATGAQAPRTAAMDSLLNQCAVYLSRQDDRTGELACLRAAWEVAQGYLSPKERDYTVRLGNLAQALVEAGEFEEAVGYMASALRLSKQHRPKSADFPGSMLQAANLRIEQAKHGQAEGWAKALRLIERARAIFEALPGSHDAMVAHCWHQAGFVLDWMQRPEDSLRARTEAVRIQRKAIPGAQELAMSLYGLGGQYLELGAVERALPQCEKAHEIMLARQPDRPDHEDRYNAADWLSIAYLVQARATGNTGLWEAKARALCADYGFDFNKEKAHAAQYDTTPQIDLSQFPEV